LRIVRITEPIDLDALYKFRHDVFVEQLEWLSADESGLLWDEYDEIAYNYAAYDSAGTVVGGVRVVPDSPIGLPLERYAPLNGYRDGRVVGEVSRLAVHPDYVTSRLAMRLMKAAFERAEFMGLTEVVMDTSVDGKTIGLYERMGFSRVGEPFVDTFHHGFMRCVMLAQAVSDVRGVWADDRPTLYRLFTTPDPSIIHQFGENDHASLISRVVRQEGILNELVSR
jgi:N-acyl-L-homoserine lactone synthetase